jgi:hypothetical protein
MKIKKINIIILFIFIINFLVQIFIFTYIDFNTNEKSYSDEWSYCYPSILKDKNTLPANTIQNTDNPKYLLVKQKLAINSSEVDEKPCSFELLVEGSEINLINNYKFLLTEGTMQSNFGTLNANDSTVFLDDNPITFSYFDSIIHGYKFLNLGEHTFNLKEKQINLTLIEFNEYEALYKNSNWNFINKLYIATLIINLSCISVFALRQKNEYFRKTKG